MNFDDALSTRIQKNKHGMRNSKREWLHDPKQMCSSLLIEVTLFGLQITISMGIKKLIVEGNSKTVIEAMKETLKECLNEIRNCIKDCKDLLISFDTIIPWHANMSRNKIMYLLAKSSFENKICTYL